MHRKILILGGTRFHGYQLAQYFITAGDEVYVLNRGNYRQVIDTQMTHLIADRNDKDSLAAAFHGKYFDAVIDNNAYNPAHVETILEAMRGRFDHYIFTSTVAVYLSLSSENKKREEDATGISEGPYPPGVKEYALNKLASENTLRNSKEKIKFSVLRFPNIYGEGDFVGKLSYFYYRLQNGGKILIEDEVKKFSIIYVQDVVSAFDAVILNKACYGQTINISDPEEYSFDTFFRNVYGDRFIPDRLVAIPAQEMWQNGYSYSFPWSPLMDTSLAEKLIGGMKFTPLPNWCKRTLEWELKHFGNRNLDAGFAGQRASELKLLAEYGA